MAELELSVRCKTLPNRIGFYVMCALFPIWSLVLPFILGLFLSWLLTHPGEADPNYANLFLFWLTAIPIASILLTAYFEDDKLYISKDGLAFPIFMLPFLRLKRHWKWSDLKQADIRRSFATGQPETLQLEFKSGSHCGLGAAGIKASELEQFLLAIELWGGEGTRSQELMQFQHELQNDNRGVGRATYTQLWEEELRRRFSATSFVPLEPDKNLKGGHIKIVRQIAFGGLSAIYLAQKDESDLVVVKEAVVPASADPETKQKAEEHFQREATLLIRLHHPNIAQVQDHFAEDGRNYLVLEHINGQDLRQYVKENGAVPEEQVRQWALTIAEILAYMHQQDPPIIHRDLTPDNLVLKNDGTVKLIDFGAANQFVGTATGTLVGKQAYISPEQLRGKATTQSDLYSLGGTLFYLLTGQDPVPLATAKISEVKADISAEMDELVVALTEFESDKRMDNANELIERLKALGVGGTIISTSGSHKSADGGTIISLAEKETVKDAAASGGNS